MFIKDAGGMDKESAALAREKARRAHRSMQDSVACFCNICKRDKIPPRTERSHRKRARWQRLADVRAPLPPNVALLQQFKLCSSRIPVLHLHPILPLHLLRVPRLCQHCSCDLLLPCGLAGAPLRLRRFLDLCLRRFPVRRLIPRLENSRPDGDLSDLAEEENGLDLDQGDFFGRLLDQNDYHNDAHLELVLEGLAGDPPSPDGSELGLDDDDLGLPDRALPAFEPPCFEFDENGGP
ncbi:hypothetical protein FS749_012178 [Ceratobasidium sp. UAMH 11750]|nr:hypothetical protein FS749_012178 [Ceratobasidium sp. UAMH 11750]